MKMTAATYFLTQIILQIWFSQTVCQSVIKSEKTSVVKKGVQNIKQVLAKDLTNQKTKQKKQDHGINRTWRTADRSRSQVGCKTWLQAKHRSSRARPILRTATKPAKPQQEKRRAVPKPTSEKMQRWVTLEGWPNIQIDWCKIKIFI